MRKIIPLLALLAAVSCTSKNTTPPPDPQAAGGLEGRVWQLTTLAVDPKPQQVPADLPITIKFESGKIEGHGGCNGYGGNYTLGGDKLLVSDIVHTEMYCEGASQWENTFFTMLPFARSFTIRDETMEINCGDMGNLVFRLNWKKRKGGE